MATEISVFDTEEFEKLIAEKDIRIANALVDTSEQGSLSTISSPRSNNI